MRNTYQDVGEILSDFLYDSISYDDALEAIVDLTDNAYWQPIDTAPKDGTVILVQDPDEMYPFACVWYTDLEEWVDAFDYDSIVNPTHWMPMPSRPNGEKCE